VDPPEIARLEGPALEAALPALADLLAEAVASGAALGFRETPSRDEALAAWRGWAREAAAGARVVLAAREAGAVVGSVQLDLARAPNARHRAELVKLMVRVDRRGRGLGLALLRAALDEARRGGRTMVWLCTTEGAAAERLYARAGFARAGEIPAWSERPPGRWRTASFWWARLA
jgi:L-amino acid N-acyltransferase YncA